jgi:hypothetical protein
MPGKRAVADGEHVVAVRDAPRRMGLLSAAATKVQMNAAGSFWLDKPAAREPPSKRNHDAGIDESWRHDV